MIYLAAAEAWGVPPWEVKHAPGAPFWLAHFQAMRAGKHKADKMKQK